VLRLTPAGVRVIKGEIDAGVELYRQPRPVARKERARRARAAGASWEGVDEGLFEALRQCRTEIARARGVPPYVVFHDTTLRELARLQPTTRDALLEVHGIGARKAEEFGDQVLRVIAEAGRQKRELPGEPSGK
jgi:ATP-dependent DNA helicase RecQ